MPDEPPLPPSHSRLPHSSGTLTPPPPAALAGPNTATVLPAKAGIQGRVASLPHHQPPSHPQLPHHTVGAVRDSDHPEPLEPPVPQQRDPHPSATSSTCRPAHPHRLIGESRYLGHPASHPHHQLPSHPQLPHHTVGAVRDSDHPEPLEGPSRSSGTLTPPLPAVLAVPRTPTVLPAKAGIQGRVAGRPRYLPPSHPQLPHHTVRAVREPPVPQQRVPLCHHHHSPARTPHRLTGKSRYPGQGLGEGRSPFLAGPHTPHPLRVTAH